MDKELSKELLRKYKGLVSEINKLDYHYFTLDRPLAPDSHYDELYNTLIELEEKYPGLASESSSTQRGRQNCIGQNGRSNQKYPSVLRLR